MFQAIRNFFTASSSPALDERKIRKARRLAGLFLFEFIVVVVGVLVAQMLQERMADRRARAEARMAVARERAEFAQFRGVVEYWNKAAPCLSARMDRIARSAATNTPLAAADFARPSLPSLSISPLAGDAALVARQVYGDRLVYEYWLIARSAERMSNFTTGVTTDWTLLQLLDPALGQPSAQDRAEARAAAMRIKALVTALEVNSGNLLESLQRLQIPVAPRVYTFELPSDCGR